jgi:outer membrane phospholipase A
MKIAFVLFFLGGPFLLANENPVLPKADGPSVPEYPLVTLDNPKSPFKIQEHRPNYIIIGKPDTRLQASFKYLVSDKLHLYFAYSQYFHWDLFIKKSSPFRDVNYNPEIFHSIKSPWAIADHFDFGYAHLSNGKDGAESRSLEKLFFYAFTKDRVLEAIKLDTFLYRAEENLDYTDFVGPLTFRFQLAHLIPDWVGFHSMYLEIRPGGTYAHLSAYTSIETGTYWKVFGQDHPLNLYFRYFRGYGENLLEYSELRETYRIGLSLDL